jgi:hypothetical protein
MIHFLQIEELKGIMKRINHIPEILLFTSIDNSFKKIQRFQKR